MSELLENRDVIMVQRTRDKGVRAHVVPAEGDIYELQHLVRHSPTGFEYGYGGSGPADLALSILAAVVGHARADRWYQQFKAERIAPESRDRWSIKAGTVRDWVKQQERLLQEAEKADE